MKKDLWAQNVWGLLFFILHTDLKK